MSYLKNNPFYYENIELHACVNDHDHDDRDYVDYDHGYFNGHGRAPNHDHDCEVLYRRVY